MAALKKEKPIIEVKHLSKQYNIGIDRTYKTFCESFTSAVRHPLKTLKDCRRPNDTFWALKDVNFEIERGEVVGIIGRNGAGKSTLLKVLSRITHPTEGEVIMRGRVGSLLEVGTGFHPELTGRENIYFNGSILGMKKREIDEKFDEIVKFSGVEKFLDTPVKRYSSGMQVRLAFSVAANLEPEILIVDEVLAVGDSQFQKKCLGKMESLSSEGRTVLFVSHNMESIGRLCTRGIYLKNGKNIYDDSIEDVIKHYFKDSSMPNEGFSKNGISVQVSFLDNNRSEMNVWEYDKELTVRVDLKSEKPLYEPAIDLAFYSENNVKIFAVRSDKLANHFLDDSVAELSIEFILKNIGIGCNFLTVDLGIKANRNPRYLAMWQNIQTLGISFKGVNHLYVADSLAIIPCQVEILDE
ncbi:MAG TPA: ABC transporter ATP-binding protein [Methanosarcina sp.]|nr:ABC transporter ATP-binding protein [Methanosarcina sp.]